jgi:hypothetical protein
VAPKNPLGKTANAAAGSIKHPLSTTGKVVEQAKGTVALGKTVTGRLGRAAASMAAETASSVLGKATGRKPVERPASTSPQAPRAESPTTLRSVPDVNEPGHTPAENKSTGPVKPHGDPLRKLTPAAKAVKGPVAKKAAQAEPTTKKAAAQKRASKAAAKKAAAKKAAAKKTPAKKAAAERVPAKKSPAKGAPAKKTSAKKTPAKMTPAKQAPIKKTTAKKTAKKAVGPGRKTPVGTTAAAAGVNPSTTETD